MFSLVLDGLIFFLHPHVLSLKELLKEGMGMSTKANVLTMHSTKQADTKLPFHNMYLGKHDVCGFLTC